MLYSDQSTQAEKISMNKAKYVYSTTICESTPGTGLL